MNPIEMVFRQVLEATVFGSVLAGIVYIVQGVAGKGLAPQWRYALWLLVLARLLIPTFPESRFSLFNAPSWFEAKPEAKVTISTTAAVLPLDVPAPNFSPMKSIAEAPARAMTVMQALAIGWAGVTCILVLRLVVGSCWLRLRLASATQPDPQLLQVFSECRSRLRTFWNPKLVETTKADSPGLFGCIFPRLLVPHGMAAQLTPSELRHVFLHELAHLKRADLFTNLLMSFAQALHWFNPVVWLVLRRLRVERELACDAMVLASTDAQDRRAYGETILKLLDRVQRRQALPAVIGVMEDKSSAAARLKQIANYSGAKKSWPIGVALLAVLGVAGLSNAQTQKIEQITSEAAVDVPVNSKDNLNETPAGSLQDLYRRQKETVEKRQHDLDELRAELKVTDNRFFEEETQWKIQRDRLVANERYLHYEKLLGELKKRPRAELRKLIPTAAPDAAMDRYLGDLAKVEQHYAANVHNLASEHPEMIDIVEMMKTINQQIEDRIDGVLGGLELQVAQSKALMDELGKQLEEVKQNARGTREQYEPYFRAKRNLEREQRLLDELHVRVTGEQKTPPQIDNRRNVGRNVVADVDQGAATVAALVEDARLLLELGQVDQAEAKLNEALKRDPDHRATRYYLNNIRTRQNQESPERSAASGDVKAQPEPLRTRTYKVQSRVFQENVESVAGKKLETAAETTEALRNLLNEAGATFPEVAAGGNPSQRQKALFYNDRTGVITARAAMKDLDVMERTLQLLNIAPTQVHIETRIIEIEPGAAYEQELLLRAVATNRTGRMATVTELMNDPQFRNVIDALDGREGKSKGGRAAAVPLSGVLQEDQARDLIARLSSAAGVDVLAAPKVITLSSRRARISIEPGPSVDLLPVVEADGKRIRLAADVEIPADAERKREAVKGGANARLSDGETFVLLPPATGKSTVVVLVTPVIIDAAGNRVHRPGNKE